ANGYTGTVNLSASPSTPAGLTCTLPPSVTFGSSPQYASLSCSATVGGDYSVTVTGAIGTLSRTTAAITFHVVADFSGSANPSSLSIQIGYGADDTITVTSLSGFSGTVTLTSQTSQPQTKGITATI